MANDLTAILMKALAMAAPVLRKRAAVARMVYKDPAIINANGLTKEKGQSIEITIPVKRTSQDLTPGTVPTANVEYVKRTVTFGYYRGGAFTLSDKEVAMIDEGKRLPEQLEVEIDALAQDINAKLVAVAIANFCNQIDVADPVTTGFITKAGRLLTQADCPEEDRAFVLSTNLTEECQNLSAFNNAASAGNNETLVQGTLGRKFNFEFDKCTSLDAETFSAGDLATDSGATVKTAAAKDATSVTLVQATGETKTLKAGQLIKLAGDTKYYPVAANVSIPTGATGAAVTLGIALRCAIAANATVTVNTAVKKQISLAFHKKALVIASLPCKPPTILSPLANVATITDPVTGLALNLEVIRTAMQTSWILSCLYGVSVGAYEDHGVKAGYNPVAD